MSSIFNNTNINKSNQKLIANNCNINGNSNSITGNNNNIIGNNNNIIGNNNNILGNNNNIFGNNNNIIGNNKNTINNQINNFSSSNFIDFYTYKFDNTINEDVIYSSNSLQKTIEIPTDDKDMYEEMIKKIESIQDIPGKDNDKDCVICYKNISRICIIPCGHFMFCKQCMVKIILFQKEKSKTCPICNKSIKDIVVIFS